MIMVIRGQVIRRPYAVGSKSERLAVMLATPKGQYVLRRVGANSYSDPELDELIGKQIVCEGNLHRDTLLMSSWRPAE